MLMSYRSLPAVTSSRAAIALGLSSGGLRENVVDGGHVKSKEE